MRVVSRGDGDLYQNNMETSSIIEVTSRVERGEMDCSRGRNLQVRSKRSFGRGLSVRWREGLSSGVGTEHVQFYRDLSNTRLS